MNAIRRQLIRPSWALLAALGSSAALAARLERGLGGLLQSAA